MMIESKEKQTSYWLVPFFALRLRFTLTLTSLKSSSSLICIRARGKHKTTQMSTLATLTHAHWQHLDLHWTVKMHTHSLTHSLILTFDCAVVRCCFLSTAETVEPIAFSYWTAVISFANSFWRRRRRSLLSLLNSQSISDSFLSIIGGPTRRSLSLSLVELLVQEFALQSDRVYWHYVLGPLALSLSLLFLAPLCTHTHNVRTNTQTRTTADNDGELTSRFFSLSLSFSGLSLLLTHSLKTRCAISCNSQFALVKIVCVCGSFVLACVDDNYNISCLYGPFNEQAGRQTDRQAHNFLANFVCFTLLCFAVVWRRWRALAR